MQKSWSKNMGNQCTANMVGNSTRKKLMDRLINIGSTKRIFFQNHFLISVKTLVFIDKFPSKEVRNTSTSQWMIYKKKKTKQSSKLISTKKDLNKAGVSNKANEE